MNRKQAPNKTKEVDTESQMMVPEQRINLLEKNTYAQEKKSRKKIIVIKNDNLA